MTTTWRCGECQKWARVEADMPNGTSAYDAVIPRGWAWAKYASIRRPDADARALGCSPEHARAAARSFTIDESTITITKIQE